MISHIELTGFRDVASGGYDLGPATLILGRVGSGKSTLPDAIRFAALGCVPSVGKDEAATSKNVRAGSSRAVVACTLAGSDPPRGIMREFARVEAAWTATPGASWIDPREATRTVISQQITALFGRNPREAEENLDILRLLDVSGKELARAIEQLLDDGGFDSEARIARGIEIWKARLDATRPQVDGMTVAPDPATTIAVGVLEPELRAHLADGIVPTMGWLKARRADAADAAKVGIANRSSYEARLMELRAPAENEERLRAAHKAASDELAAKTQQLATAERIGRLRADAQRDLDLAAAAVPGAAERLARCKAEAEAVPAITARLEALTDPPATPPVVETPPDAELLRQFDAMKAEAATFTTMLAAVVVPPEMHLDREEIEVEGAKRALRAAQENKAWRRVEEIQEDIRGLVNRCADEHATQPPPDNILFMASEVAHSCRSLERLAHDNAGDLEVLQIAVDKAEQALAAAKIVQTAREAERAERLSDQVEMREQVALHNREADKLFARAHREARAANDAAWAAYRQAEADRATLVAAQKTVREQLVAEISRLETDVRIAERVKVDADAALASVQARMSGLADAAPVDVAETTAACAALRETVARLDEQVTVARNAAGLRNEIKTLAARIESAAATRDVAAAAIFAVERLRDEDMRARSGGLEGRMAAFLKAAGRAETPYMRCAKGAAEFGWRLPDGNEVAVEVLSGGQGVVFRAALAYAVIAQRAPEQRVLVVELAEAGDGVTNTALLRALGSIAHEVQVIACSCVPVAAPDGWTVLEIDRGF